MGQEPRGNSAVAIAADHAQPLASSKHPTAAVYYYLGLSVALAQWRAAAAAAGGVFDLGDASRRRRGCRWWRATELSLREKVAALELQVDELRRRRGEDARANEKVAGIFASHEQRWLAERNSLRRQVHAVAAAARARERKREEEAAELERQLEEQKATVALRERALEQEVERRQGAEERLRAAEEELSAAAEAARKHRAALVEMASEQRRMEADLARAARRGDAAEAELRDAVERRDEAASVAAEVSAEAARLRREGEHKDRILSAVLRKSKVDVEEREMLVKEVKMGKARRKKAELEAERWRKMWESSSRGAGHGGHGHRRGSSRSSDKVLAPDAVQMARENTKILFVDHVEGDGKKDHHRQAAAKEMTAIECVDRYASHLDDKPAVEEYQGLQEWFQMETEKYTAMMKHRHAAEVEAFTEQLRLKDEKLEAFRWRAVSMDVEATRLRGRIQDLESRLARHEKRSAALEALLQDREHENRALEEQLLQTIQAQPPGGAQDDGAEDDQRMTCSSPVKQVAVVQRTTSFKDEPVSVSPEEHKEDWNSLDVHADATTEALVVSVGDLVACAAQTSREHDERHDDAPAASRPSFRSEIEEEKEVYTDPGNAETTTGSSSSSQEAAATSELALVVMPPQMKTTTTTGQKSSAAWKTDIHALAVSYKIKRLRQQLLVLEKLANECKEEPSGMTASEASCSSSSSSSCSTSSSSRQQQPRSRYQTMMSFLSKHVKRYQSLDDKIDDLCARMEESKRSAGREREESQSQSAALGQFLEETFQLQRFMVATGQKLLETQPRIAAGLARERCDGDGDGVDMTRLMEVTGALLRDVQRGLEVRIARIIGDLEGTLTFHGILRTTPTKR